MLMLSYDLGRTIMSESSITQIRLVCKKQNLYMYNFRDISHISWKYKINGCVVLKLLTHKCKVSKML